MERIRFADGVPVRLERNYYAEAYRDIIYEDLEKSVHKILQEKYGLSNPRKLDFTIAIGYANEEEAKLLQIEKKSPLLKVHGVLKNSRGQGVYQFGDVAFTRSLRSCRIVLLLEGCTL